MDKETFCETSGQQDGYLQFNEHPYPCILLDENMYVRKMYTNSSGLNKFLNNKKYYINPKFKKNIQRQYLDKKDFFFINIDGDEVFQKYFEYSGSRLPSQVGEIRGTYREINNSMPGFITFGPYIRLNEGKYTFNISYNSSESNTTVVGNWDVVFALPKQVKILKKGDLIGTNNKESHIIQSFTIPKEYSNEKIEIRNFYNGIGDLTIKSLTITREQ
jgi:hypothetical protein